jgi:hypothetical protein
MQPRDVFPLQTRLFAIMLLRPGSPSHVVVTQMRTGTIQTLSGGRYPDVCTKLQAPVQVAHGTGSTSDMWNNHLPAPRAVRRQPITFPAAHPASSSSSCRSPMAPITFPLREQSEGSWHRGAPRPSPSVPLGLWVARQPASERPERVFAISHRDSQPPLQPDAMTAAPAGKAACVLSARGMDVA